jgi:hypothetical protein
MKNFLLCFFIAICPTLGFSQKLTISDEIPMHSDLLYEIIGEIRGRVLLFNRESGKYSITALDENMRPSWDKEIELDRKNAIVIGVNATEEAFTVFYFFREKGSTFLKAARFDPSANLRDSATLADLGFLFMSPSFKMVSSEDRSKVLLNFTERDQVFKSIVFDNKTMRVLWQQNFQYPDYDESEDVLHLIVSNAGQMYAVFEKDHYQLRREKHRYDVFLFDPEITTEFSRFSIPLKGNITYDVKFVFDNGNRKLCAGGFYFEKNVERAEGYFTLFIPRDPTRTLLRFYPFEDEFVDRLAGKETRNNRGLEQVSVVDLVLRKDGGLLLVGEESKNFARRMATVNRNMMLDNMNRSVVDYYFEDVFILAIRPNGTLQWSTILHKKQYSQDDDGAFSSFFLFKTPAFLRLVFNDEIKFENTVSEYLLHTNGDFDRNSILSTETLQLRLRFRDAIQVSASRMLVPSERRGKLRIARIDLL